ncbi:FAD-dependent monooxygenase [Bradyrhizobium sp. LHD-71]|uniref:FAD-dependent monooxygenase n=1 Tax=Bradyrhizobium sp. LHD-71 TaxID=3072141 RepID=UPI00280EA453|nr:FAD-dependent monooxygenase [Bradyrhizobium sp. LHD-71]MDQ8732095.1 FAD-dependent monooxygenase [Bradyrhizobium sp. LHD-71]
MTAKPTIAIIGAGIGGLALAAFLHRAGANVEVYEQATQFQRVGAGIQMSPNAIRVLRSLGLEQGLRQRAFQPRSWDNRVWDTGERLSELNFADAESRYGAPYLLMHRADLHAALFSAVPAHLIAFNKKLTGLDRNGASIDLRFADQTRATVDAVIGADGVHSIVREVLLGPERPRFTGRVAHRTVFPTALMRDFALDNCTKWWGPDRHIVTYPVTASGDETYFVTSVPDPSWDVESWSAAGDMEEVRLAFAGFHDDVQRVLAASPQVHKWALFERDPLPRWAFGPIVLLGDACHPMTPYMAQGGASALEDAAILARCLDNVNDVEAAFRRYEATRLERTARLQLTSRENTWGKRAIDPGWVYGYDVWQTPVAASGAAPGVAS